MEVVDKTKATQQIRIDNLLPGTVFEMGKVFYMKMVGGGFVNIKSGEYICGNVYKEDWSHVPITVVNASVTITNKG